MDVSRELAEEHYAEHREKPSSRSWSSSSPRPPWSRCGSGARAPSGTVRNLMGATNPAEAAPGTIRGDLALSMPDNLVHGSDSPGERHARAGALLRHLDEGVRFVLASESARRVDLLARRGLRLRDPKERLPRGDPRRPEETVVANARGKALAVDTTPDEVVLAADTVVYLPFDERRILGQAKSGEEVRRMLLLLRGRAHEVHSGVAVAGRGELAVRHAVTTVRMRAFGEEELEAYVRPGRRRRQGRRLRHPGQGGGFRRVDRRRLHQRRWACPSRSR